MGRVPTLGETRRKQKDTNYNNKRKTPEMLFQRLDPEQILAGIP